MSFGKTEGLHLKDTWLLSLTWVFLGNLNSFYDRTCYLQAEQTACPVSAPTDLSVRVNTPASSTKSLWFPRSQLSSRCHGFDKAIITQANTAVGSKLVYDGEKRRTLQVTPEIFSTFAKVWGLLFMDVTTVSAVVVPQQTLFHGFALTSWAWEDLWIFMSNVS